MAIDCKELKTRLLGKSELVLQREQKLRDQEGMLAKLRVSIENMNTTLEQEKIFSSGLSKRLEDTVNLSGQETNIKETNKKHYSLQSTDSNVSSGHKTTNTKTISLKKHDSSHLENTVLTRHSSCLNEDTTNIKYKTDFLSYESGSLDSKTEKKGSSNDILEITEYKRRSSKKNLEDMLDSTELNVNEGHDIHDEYNTTLSAIHENQDITRRQSSRLETLFKSKKLRGRIMEFLGPSDMIALRSSCSSLNFTVSQDSRVFRFILQHHHSQFQNKIESLEKKLSLFEGNTANISGDYVQFLLYKYVKLKKAPGSYIQGAFSKGNGLFDLTKNPAKIKLNVTTEQITDNSGKLFGNLMSGGLANNWQNIKKTMKSKIAEKLDGGNSNGDTNNLDKVSEFNNSYVFIEEPAVKEEMQKLENKSKLQDFEALATKLEMN